MKYKTTLFFVIIVASTLSSYRLSARDVTVGVYKDEPIVFFDDKSGDVKGIYIDILEYIAGEANWKLRYQKGSWEECLKRLRESDIDLLVGIALTAERQAEYDFNTEPLLMNWGQMYVGRNAEIKYLMELSGKTVAVVKNDVHFEMIRNIEEGFNIQPVFVQVDSYYDVLELIHSGAVSAGIVPSLYGMYYEDRFDIKKSFINFSPVEIRFAVLKDHNGDIIETIDRNLKRLKGNKNSLYYRSVNIWTEGVNKLVFPDWLNPLWVVSAAVGIILIALLISIILRRQVKIRTEILKKTIRDKEVIDSELRIAHQIQMEIVPKSLGAVPGIPEIDVHAVIEPARQIGGDFYDFFPLDDHRLFFVIGDVSDKGIPAALMMSHTKALIKSTAKLVEDMEKIFEFVNHEICLDNDSAMFVTAFSGLLDIRNGNLDYIVAGHHSPIIFKNGHPPIYLEGRRSTALGVDEKTVFSNNRAKFEPGHIILLYTDGVTEAIDEDHHVFTDERLMAVLQDSSENDVEKLIVSIMDTIKKHVGKAAPSDDITMMAIKYK